MSEPIATLLAANIDGAKQSPVLLGYIKKYDPDVVVLEECPRERAWFQNIPGYKIAAVAPLVTGDRRSVVTLTRRKTVKIEHTWVIRMYRAWWGPGYGRKHHGKAWTPMRLVISGNRLRVLPAHFQWGYKNAKNRPAWNEGLREAIKFLTREGEAPLLLIGDINANKDVVQEIADRHKWDVATFGAVDHAVGAGCLVSAERLEPASGHGWGVVTVRPARKDAM